MSNKKLLSKIKIVGFLVIIVVLGIVSVTGNKIFSTNKTLEVPLSRTMTSQNGDPIFIDSNNDFNKYYFPGDGSIDNPFLIENLIINSSIGSLILIQNTNFHFVIRNNKVNGLNKANYAIELSNVSHGSILRNIVKNNDLFGIIIRFSNNVIIKDNFITNNNLGGLYVYSSSEITISMNAIHNNRGYGIFFRDSVISSNILRNCFIGNQNYGLLLGRTSDGDNPSVNLNYINENTFINNSFSFQSQAADWGENNVFSSNYWNDWLDPDTNSDGWVDNPYLIDAFSDIWGGSKGDFSPRNTNPTPQLLIPLILLHPNGGETYEGKIRIEWTSPSSFSNSELKYLIEISNDKNNWKKLADNLNSTNFLWYTGTESNGDYFLKITAYNENDFSIDIISEESIKIKNISIFYNLFIQIFVLVGLFGVIIVLGFLFYNFKLRKKVLIRDLVQNFTSDLLRSLYHKIIIGIDNAKMELLGESITSELFFDFADNTALANIFPDNLRNEMKTDIRGKTVLILTELAYQPSGKSHSAFIAEILSIPRQTVSDEIKRMLKLQYLQPVITNKTLLDARYKHYSITRKGIVFLHLLKESIRVTLMQVHKENIDSE